MSSCCSKLMRSAFDFNVELAHLDHARQSIVHKDVQPPPPPPLLQARIRPSAPSTRQLFSPVGPSSIFTALPLGKRQSPTAWSVLPLASHLPSGVMTRALMGPM